MSLGMNGGKNPDGGILIIAENRKARFDYHILETFEAGLVLTGSEVKSMRDRQVQLKDSYIAFVGGEPFLQKAHIAEYKNSSYNNHHPERLRKLLLNKSELIKLDTSFKLKGTTCIPLKIYFKKGRAKLEIALVKSKNKADKRDTLKTRDETKMLKNQLRTSR